MSDPEDGYEAIVDYTEPPQVREALEACADVRDVLIGDLPAGDIVIGDVGFERKTPEDYASSITDRRIDTQTDKMGRSFDNAYVLIEGNVADFKALTHTSMRASSLRGHMASLTAREGSGVNGVIPCSDLHTLADMAVRLARKHHEEPTPPTLPPDDMDDDVSTLVKIVAQTPGIGGQTARRIAAEFPSVPLLISAIEEGAIDSIDGVGPKTKEELREAFIRPNE